MMKRYQLNSDSSIPLYKQIVKIMCSEFEEGELVQGEKLPSEMELMEIFDVSRITIRAAIDELQTMGLVKRSRGKGTFVAAQPGAERHPREKGTFVTAEMAQYSGERRVGFIHSCALAGKTATTKLLDISWMYPNVLDLDFFKIEEDEQIISTERLRFIDGIPTTIEKNHYIKELAYLFEEDLTSSLYDIYKKHGMQFGKSTRTLEVCYAGQQEAMLLNVKKGSALLLFTDMVMDDKEKPIYISRQIYCTERLKFYL